MPYSINHCSQLVLDVVLSTSIQSVPANLARFDPVGGQTNVPVSAPVNDRVTIAFGSTPPKPETSVSDIGFFDTSSNPSSTASAASVIKTPSKPALSFKQVVKLASKNANESRGLVQQQKLNAKIDHVINSQEQLIKSQEQLIKSQEEMKQLQKAFDAKQDEMNKSQEEMKQLQKALDSKQDEMKQLALDHHKETKELQQRALGQLAVLQSRVQAVLTQTYELHEYPIP
ncbi:hypothetical protein BGZ97_010377, partial [Linnemannia gamsii]